MPVRRRRGPTGAAGAAGSNGLLQSAVVSTVGAGVDSTSSPTYVDVVGASITITTGANFVLVWGRWCYYDGGLGLNGFRIIVDATQIDEGQQDITVALSATTISLHGRLAVSAGSHTIKLQWKKVNGVSVVKMDNDARSNARLMVAEVIG